jgi:hypothetical protein
MSFCRAETDKLFKRMRKKAELFHLMQCNVKVSLAGDVNRNADNWDPTADIGCSFCWQATVGTAQTKGRSFHPK